MSKDAFAGIVLVVAAAVALWFLLDREGTPRGRPAPGARVSEAETPAQIEAPGRSPQPESRGLATIRPTAFVDEASRTGAAAGEALRVLVLDDATGIPVPGAEVAWTDESRTQPVRGGVWSSPPTLVSDFDHAPQRTIADARGVAVVRTSPKLAVAARSGDRFGLWRFRDSLPRGEIRLPIVAGPFVAARVVDGAGAPVVGVPVTISVNVGQAGRGFYAVSRSPDGLAIVHHQGVVLEHFSRGAIKEVTAAIEGVESLDRVKATGEELKAGPITLVMPPTGRVVVKVLGPEGRPFLSRAEVSLVAEQQSPLSRVHYDAGTTNGSAEFPMVQAGKSLTASAEAAGFDLVRSEITEGPKAAGEQVTIELRFHRRRAVVRGRAVDKDGAPLCGRPLEAELVRGDRVLILPAAMRLSTDSRGGFTFEVDRGTIREDDDLLLQTRDDDDAVELNVRTVLPKLSRDGETSLGDVCLTPVLLFATGVVVDELGAPVAGALVIADEFSGGGSSGVFTFGPRNLPSWVDLLRGRTDDAGAFRIMNPEISGWRITGFTLRAEKPGFVCPDRPWSDRPSKDFKIVLQGTGTIEGRIKLPDLAPVRKLRIEVLVSDCTPGCKAGYKFEDCVDSTGAFRIEGIQPGTARIDVRMAGMTDPLASVASVLVRRLATSDDARLREIDLRGHPALRP